MPMGMPMGVPMFAAPAPSAVPLPAGSPPQAQFKAVPHMGFDRTGSQVRGPERRQSAAGESGA
jgi:hypothetical protein